MLQTETEGALSLQARSEEALLLQVVRLGWATPDQELGGSSLERKEFGSPRL